MNYQIALIQQGVTASTHPVTGKSGKLYGHATASPPHGGVMFLMPLEEYMAHAHDLVGNLAPGQQWVPEMVLSHGTPAQKCDRCSKPATAKMGQYFFCDEHAPNDAIFFDGRPRKLVAQPPKPPAEERLSPPVQDKHEEVELPQEHMAAPSIGTAREEVEPDKQTIAHVAPQPPVPHTPPRAEEPRVQLRPASDKAPSGATNAVEVIAGAVVNKLLPKLDEIVAAKVKALLPPAQMRKPAKKTAPRAPRAQSEFSRLQARAKELGINSFGKKAEELKAAIAAKAESDIPF